MQVTPFPFERVLFANPMVSLDISAFCVGYDGKLYLAAAKNDCVFVLSQSQPIKVCVIDKPCALVPMQHGDIAVLSQKPGTSICVSFIDCETGVVCSSMERTSHRGGLVKGMCLDNDGWILIKRTAQSQKFGGDSISSNVEEIVPTQSPNFCDSFVCVPGTTNYIQVVTNHVSCDPGCYLELLSHDGDSLEHLPLPPPATRKGVSTAGHLVVLSRTHAVLLRDRTLTRIDMRTLQTAGEIVLPQSLPPGMTCLNGYSGKVGDCRYSEHMSVDIDGLLYIPVYVAREFTKKDKQYGPGLVSILIVRPDQF